MNPDDQKEAIKEALSEWLDDKFSEFGKWSLKGWLLLLLWVLCIYGQHHMAGQ